MAINKKVKKDELHELVDQIDPSDHEVIYVLLKKFAVADEWKIEADNSPVTEEELQEIEEARQRVKNGEYVDWEDIKREYQF